MMALIVETGQSSPDSNSYISLADARAYADARGLVLPVADADCEAALLNAMPFIESFYSRYQGFVSDPEQALQFPRTMLILNGNTVESDVVPNLVVQAQVQAAVEIAAGVELIGTTSGQLVTEETVGPITTKYSDEYLATIDGKTYYGTVMVYLEPLFIQTSGYRLTQRHGF